MTRRILMTLLVICLTPFAAQSQSLSHEEQDYIQANTIFFTYHELGHALIDLLRLPVFGQEEDAADVLGVVLSETINNEDDNEFIMLAAADNFSYMAQTAQQEGYELAFWDLHGLDLQRYYTILCLHYGADPDRRKGIADEQELPEARQQTCPQEYTLAEESWGPILDEAEFRPDAGPWLTLHVVDQPRNEAQQAVLSALSVEVDILNDSLSPAFALDVLFGQCGEANAYYDPDSAQITICAELAELFTE